MCPKKMSFNSIVRLVKIQYQKCLENYDSNQLLDHFNDELPVGLKQNVSQPNKVRTNIEDLDFEKLENKKHNNILHNGTNSTSGINRRSAELDQMLCSKNDDEIFDDDKLNELSLPLFAVPELPICKCNL